MTKTLSFADIVSLARQTFSEWSEDKAPKMSAALACFTILSLAPLLVVVLKIISIRYGNDEAIHHLHDQLATLTDHQVADSLATLIPKPQHARSGTFAAVLSLVVALLSASGVFGELQDSLNTIWEVRPKPNRGIMGTIRDRFLSMSMVFGIAFLLLVTMVISSVISVITQWMLGHMAGGPDGHLGIAVSFIADLLISTAAVTVLFAAMYKVLPDATIRWSDVWLGAGVTAVLFQLGKYALSLYMGISKPGVAYGIAGSLAVVLIWIYYSAWILFLGAEFTQVYANRFGSKIVPSKNAEPLTREMREQMGVVSQSERA
jgi:membrane protein